MTASGSGLYPPYSDQLRPSTAATGAQHPRSLDPRPAGHAPAILAAAIFTGPALAAHAAAVAPFPDPLFLGNDASPSSTFRAAACATLRLTAGAPA